MLPAEPDPKLKTLPRLREDLQLIDPDEGRSGAASRLIYDPLRHRFVRIDRGTYELMSLLQHCTTLDELRERAWTHFGISVTPEQLDNLCEFLVRSDLVIPADTGNWRALQQQAERARKGILSRLIHNYLFFKIPLVRPQRFLEATLPLVTPLMSRGASAIIVTLGAIGLYLVSRQWDAFTTTFHHAFTVQGAITFAVALALVKTLHELGHAYVAVRNGCRVASLGIAFMLLTPLLYTDVTDAWRLKDPRQRLQIDAAGIIVELALALLATFLWVFLPEGPPKSLAFAVATVSWVMSLFFNLNPFMRFDGYYLLSDFLRVENLQTRAFALARWKLREVLFGLNAPRPEVLNQRLQTTLIIYAWATWVYRLILFTGIALLVYTLFFKVLGLTLFVVEIAVFIAIPIWSEIKEWIAMRKAIASRTRSYISLSVLALVVLAVATPWSTRVDIPAILTVDDIAPIYPVRAARVQRVLATRGDHVNAGDILIELRAPELIRQEQLARVRIKVTQTRLSRRMADKLDRAESLVLNQELASLKTKLNGLTKEQNELIIRAPISGTVAELNPDIHPNRWLAKTEQVALIGQRRQHTFKGYVSEDDVERLQFPATGRFIPDDPTVPASDVELTSVSKAGATEIDIQDLASTFGGPIAVREDADHRLVPVSAQFLVTLKPGGTPPPLAHTQRGVVHLTGTPQSILARVWRRVLAVLVRESGV